MHTTQCKTMALPARRFPTIAVFALLLSAAGCDAKPEASSEKTESKAKGDPDGADKPDGPKPAAAVEPKAEAGPEMAEYVLDPGGPEWVGWVATAPAGCKVMEDGSKRVRIACGRKPRFDVLFDQAEVDFEARKKNLSEANAKTPETVRTVMKDEADALAWKSENKEHGFTTLSFLERRTVDGVIITCGNLPTRGLADDAAVQLHQRACASVAKKK